MKFNKYIVYFEDGEHVYREPIASTSKAKAKEYFNGNGDIIKVQDFHCPIDNDNVAVALKNGGFTQDQIDIVTRALYQLGIAD